MDSCLPVTSSSYSLGLTKKEVRVLFRKGNRLLENAVNAVICPLGDINKNITRFESWTNSQHYSISNYFEKTFMTESAIACERYNRPVTRGRDGYLYSHSEMDSAMMGY